MRRLVAPEPPGHGAGEPVRILLTLILWALLLVLCWPLAVLVLILWPFLWLLSIPFRVVGILMDGILSLVRAILLLPARLLGHSG